MIIKTCAYFLFSTDFEVAHLLRQLWTIDWMILYLLAVYRWHVLSSFPYSRFSIVVQTGMHTDSGVAKERKAEAQLPSPQYSR